MSSIVAVSENDIARIERRYTLTDREQVLRFVREAPYLLPLLHVAPDVIRRYFPGSTLRLEVVTDPEEGHTEIVLFIATQTGSPDALDALQRLDEEWWLDAARGVGRDMLVTLE